jgi:DNA-binding NtrC family response regulator
VGSRKKHCGFSTNTRGRGTSASSKIREELRQALSAGRTLASPIPALQPRREEPRSDSTPATTSQPPLTSVTQAEVPVTGSLKAIARSAAREAERELIYRTLQQTRWNRREAAEILGVSYKALLYKIKEAELDKAS